MAMTLAPRKAPRVTGLVSRNAAVPWSFSPATEPIVTRMAASTPNCPRFLVNWTAASPTTGSGTMPVSWSPPTAEMISLM